MLNGDTHTGNTGGSGSNADRFAYTKKIAKKDRLEQEPEDTAVYGASPTLPSPRHTRSPEPPLAHPMASDTPMTYAPSEKTSLSRTPSAAKPKDAALAALQDEIARQRIRLDNRIHEKKQLERSRAELDNQLDAVHERFLQCQKKTQQLQQNYDLHLQSLRATPDDRNTIREKLLVLRQNIQALATDLVRHVDPSKATQGFKRFWKERLYATMIEQYGNPLPTKYIQLFTEKYVMDMLVTYLIPGYYPGVSVAEDARTLYQWFQQQNQNDYACELQQEIARVVVQPDNKTVQQQLGVEIQHRALSLCKNLVAVYPHMPTHDQNERDASKRYSARIERLVSEALNLGYIMKGQEVLVIPASVTEGNQPFDPRLMEDEDGHGKGVVKFCINPPFFAPPSILLLKGRVLCQPSH